MKHSLCVRGGPCCLGRRRRPARSCGGLVRCVQGLKPQCLVEDLGTLGVSGGHLGELWDCSQRKQVGWSARVGGRCSQGEGTGDREDGENSNPFYWENMEIKVPMQTALFLPRSALQHRGRCWGRCHRQRLGTEGRWVECLQKSPKTPMWTKRVTSGHN